MHRKENYFKRDYLPYLLVAPQLIITLVFFITPAFNAIHYSLYSGDAFGIHSHFSGLENYLALFHSPNYINAFKVTFIYSFFVAFFAMLPALILALAVDNVVRGKGFYKTMLIWPYAVAPAIAGILWRFLFNPAIGIIPHELHKIGINWDYNIYGNQAFFLIIFAAAWQQFSYNFVFFSAGLQSIPRSVIEAAAIDGAGPWQRIYTVILPLLSPTTFFLLVMNLIYAFFSTFGIVQVMTEGGPGHATDILVYKVYNDGFVGLDLGGSAAQSVVLMGIIIALTYFQFRVIEKRVHY